MAPSASDAPPQRTSRWQLKRITGIKAPQVATNEPEIQRPKSAFGIRNPFSRQKHLTPRASRGAEVRSPTPEASSSPSIHEQLRAGPEYAPAASQSREVVVQSPPPAASQAVVVAAKEPISTRHEPIRSGARSRLNAKPADALKDTRVEIRQTGQMIRRKAWAPNSPSSSLSLGTMFQKSGVSEDTKKLLVGAIEDLRQFKREQEQKQIREEEKQEEIEEIEEAMEVVGTKVVRKGSTIKHVKVLRPAAMLDVGTLDPYARQTASVSTTEGSIYAGISSSSSIAVSQAAEIGSSSTPSMTSGSIMERPPGFDRPSRQFAARPPRLSEVNRDPVGGSSNRIRPDYK